MLFIFSFSSNIVHPEEILQLQKVFTKHCVRTNSNKSQFYWHNCGAAPLADLVNITVAYCNYYGTWKNAQK